MGYAKTNLNEVEDQAAKHGFGELQEARFPRGDVGTEASEQIDERDEARPVALGHRRTSGTRTDGDRARGGPRARGSAQT